jgi:hypothetical protein
VGERWSHNEEEAMPEVHVAIPKSGAPIVEHNFTRVHSKQDITWHFHVANPNAKFVEIEFANAATKPYFGSSGKFSKAIDATLRKAMIYGESPGGYPVGSEIDKYTIKAYDGDPAKGAKVISKLDPDIIVDTP